MGILDVFSTSIQGMSAQSIALQNISGNIANSTTVGYKTVDTSFADLIPDDGAPVGQSAGSVGTYSQLTNTMAGTISSTSTSTNMALSGDGYFVVAQNTGPSGSAPSFSGQDLYTRRGDFTPDPSGYLVNGAGYYLLGASTSPTTGASSSSLSPIQISSAPLASGATLSGVTVGGDGSLTGSYSDGSTAKLGQVTVAHIPGDAGLHSEDGGAYSLTSDSGTPVYGLDGTTIQGGAVEGSNTNITDQFSKMIMTQQAYESNSKVLTAANEMTQDAINMLS